MARPKKKERKIPKREAIVIQAAKDGVAPKLSKSKDTLGIQTSSGRIVLEAGGRGLTRLALFCLPHLAGEKTRKSVGRPPAQPNGGATTAPKDVGWGKL